jgi:hypothetical protein
MEWNFISNRHQSQIMIQKESAVAHFVSVTEHSPLNAEEEEERL